MFPFVLRELNTLLGDLESQSIRLDGSIRSLSAQNSSVRLNTEKLHESVEQLSIKWARLSHVMPNIFSPNGSLHANAVTELLNSLLSLYQLQLVVSLPSVDLDDYPALTLLVRPTGGGRGTEPTPTGR